MTHHNRPAGRIADIGAEPNAAKCLDKPFDAGAMLRRACSFGRRRTKPAHRDHSLDRLINPAIDMPDDCVEIRRHAGCFRRSTFSSCPSRRQFVVPLSRTILPRPVRSMQAIVRVAWRGRQRGASRRSAPGSEMSRKRVLAGPRAPTTRREPTVSPSSRSGRGLRVAAAADRSARRPMRRAYECRSTGRVRVGVPSQATALI